jgi:hypothetical protein
VDQTQSASTTHKHTTQNAQNEPTTQVASITQSATTHYATWPDHLNEATTPSDLPGDHTSGFLSVPPRYLDQPSSIPAHR